MYYYYVLLGVLFSPLVGWLVWRWNDIWYVSPVTVRCAFLNIKVPPGSLGYPLFGETLTYLWYFIILRRPDDFINYKKYKYGGNAGMCKSYLFGRPSIIVWSPTLCKLCLHSTHRLKQQWPNKVWGNNSVITLEGPKHTKIKSFVISIINRPDSLARLVLQTHPTVVNALQSWSHHSPIKIVDQLRKVTLDHSARHFAGLKLGPQKIGTLDNYFSSMSQGIRAQPWNFPGTNYHHALKCRKKMIEMLREELERRKRSKEESNDLMGGLMQAKDMEGNHLSDEDVLDNVLNSFFSNLEGTSLLVTWSLYYLAKSPNVLQKLREENKKISEEKKGRFITGEDILKLTYTNMVVEEVIRLSNITSFVFRKPIDDIELNGYMVPKDWQVILWIRNIHTDPTNFEDPLCFNPDRWNTRPRSGKYLPFGGGPRSCPGSMLVRFTLAVYLHHLSIGYNGEDFVPSWSLLTLYSKIS